MDNNFKIIIISYSKPIINESEMITSLLNNGLELFHLRKPFNTIIEIEKLLTNIPEEFHNRIIIHQHYELTKQFDLKGIHIKHIHRKFYSKAKYKIVSTSCHSFAELSNKNYYEYVFLSPIFDSISKKGYSSNFTLNELENANQKRIIDNKIIALGGINEKNISLIKKLGFGGAAVLGSIWNK